MPSTLSEIDIIYAIEIKDAVQVQAFFKQAKFEKDWNLVKRICDMPDEVIDPASMDGGRMIPNPCKPDGATKDEVLMEAQQALDAFSFDEPIPEDLWLYLFNLKRVFLIDEMSQAIAESDSLRIKALLVQSHHECNWEAIELVCNMSPDDAAKPFEFAHSDGRAKLLFDIKRNAPSDDMLTKVYIESLERLCLIEDVKDAIACADGVELGRLFDQARAQKNWDAIKRICDLPDGPNKPHEANFDLLYREIKNEAVGGNPDAWNDLYQMASVFYESIQHQPESGPLPKSVYTIRLEAFFRELLHPDGGQFTITHPTLGDDVYTFARTGNAYNWTEIRQYADFTHLELNPEDFDAYRDYKTSADFNGLRQVLVTMFTANNLNQALMATYLDGLYWHYDARYGSSNRPAPLMRFEEMQAIANYTGDQAYKIMNALLRGEIHDESWFQTSRGWSQEEAKGAIRVGLIESILCCHALRKLPELGISDTYRGKGTSTDDIEYYIRKAAGKEVVPLLGFTSTSINEGKATDWVGNPAMVVHLVHPIGVYVAPISKNKTEREVLVPPMDVQCIGYHFDPNFLGLRGPVHVVDFSPVTDVSHLRSYHAERLRRVEEGGPDAITSLMATHGLFSSSEQDEVATIAQQDSKLGY